MTESSLPLDFSEIIEPPFPEQMDVPIGCVGAGFIMNDCHLVAYREAGFNPIGICSRNMQRAVDAARRHQIEQVYDSYSTLLTDERIEVLDVAVPPDIQIDVIREAVTRPNIRGILAQKPLGINLQQAAKIVELCEDAGVVLAVNQNMRFDQSIRACRELLDRELLGDPVLATINMRAIPHWMPWQERLGWVTLRIMSIHHLDTMRYLFGDPVQVFASVRPDPRTAERFEHTDGICLYVLEYESGLRVSGWDDVWAGPADAVGPEDIGIEWRVEGTGGIARGTIGWPRYPARQPSTLDFTTQRAPGTRFQPRWDRVWFPDAFSGPMADLLIALEAHDRPTLDGRDNLRTMALVEACYVSAAEHRVVEMSEFDEWVG